MSFPTNECNLVGAHVYPIADLGIPAAIGCSVNEDGEVFSTGLPATVVTVISLTSGSATLKVDVADEAANIDLSSSPSESVSLSGTGKFVSVVSTTANYTADTSVLYVGHRVAGGAGGASINQFAVFVLYELEDGEDWFSIRSGLNAVGNTTVGDGSGSLSITIA